MGIKYVSTEERFDGETGLWNAVRSLIEDKVFFVLSSYDAKLIISLLYNA
jgi:hypothetical protein